MSTIPGEYCGQYTLDENNFLTKLKELNRDQLTNGLINELALWSKKNKQHWQPFMRTIICLFDLPEDYNKTLPKKFDDLQKEKRNIKKKYDDNALNEFLSKPYTIATSTTTGEKQKATSCSTCL